MRRPPAHPGIPRARVIAVPVLAVALAALAGCGSRVDPVEPVAARSLVPSTTTTTSTTTSTTTTTSTSTTTTTMTLPPTTTTTVPPTTTTVPPTTTTTVPPGPPPVTDRRLFLLGDSVLLGSQYALPGALPNWQVNLDARVSRFLPEGIGVLQARRGEIGQVAVIQMGNNYSGNEADFAGLIDQAMDGLRGLRYVVWLTVFEYQPEQQEVNRQLAQALYRWPNMRLADWHGYEASHPGLTASDGLHLKPSGAQAMAAVIAQRLGELEATGR